jgi:hypothetical protein
MKWLALAAAVAFSVAGQASAQTALFTSDTEIELTIEAPLTTLIRQAPRSTDPHPAIVTLTGAGEPSRFEIELSARGLSRRTRGYCAFPPLRLDFDKDALRGTVLEGQNRLKLVTTCRPSRNYEQIIVHEYLAYRLYNEITPLSYRVRPVRVTYRDTEGRRREETQFNFLIEDIDDVADRNQRVALDVTRGEVTVAQLESAAAARYGLFQLMIGNLDWDMTAAVPGEDCCHNSKLLAATQESREAVIPVPYDFDGSGFADAPYAAVPEGLPISNIRTRLYRGMCRHNAEIPAAIETFRARRAEINALIAGEPRLTDSKRREAQRYIDDFYEMIENPARVQSQIIQRCRG